MQFSVYLLYIDLYLPGGFVTVGQDMRGTKLSEGNFTIWHQDADDSTDLGNWIVQQPWSDGKIYSVGASADGLAAFTTVHMAPQWLRAQYYIWSSSIGYDVFYPGGTLVGELVDSWIHGTVEFPAGWDEQCYQTIIENEMHGEWWNAVELTGMYGNVNFPTAFWAGWYDIFLLGNLEAFRGFNDESSANVRHTSKIVIDPLGHCQSGAEFFKQDLLAGRSLLSLMQSYELFGMRSVKRTDVKNVTFYVMSSNDAIGRKTGQYWTSLERFPEPVMTKFFMHSDGSVSNSAPSKLSPHDKVESSSYRHDPSNPIPTAGGNNLDIPCGPLDQAENDKRSDLLKFETPLLLEPLALTGPLVATLFVSSDAVDTDFMVKISDVYPSGEVRLIQDSAVRMRWRDGGLVPVLMEKDQVYEITANLWNTSYVFATGHKLRLVVASSNSPRFSVNPNNGRSLIDEYSSPGEKIIANNVLYHSEKYPSHFLLPVVDLSQLPDLGDIKVQFNRAFPDLNADEVLLEHPDILGRIAELSAKKSSRVK